MKWPLVKRSRLEEVEKQLLDAKMEASLKLTSRGGALRFFLDRAVFDPDRNSYRLHGEISARVYHELGGGR